MIPGYTISGVLPPYIGDDPTMRPAMSPYSATLAELCKRFATSDERIRILRGLVAYRRALKSAGFSGGFQWIDGSFVEDVETTRGRPPGDVDVVTFTSLTPTLDFTDPQVSDGFLAQFSDLLDPQQCKIDYACDAYLVNLSAPPITLVDDTRYWFGLFSHQRETALWKGILVIDFEGNEDDACHILESAT